ncbi:MAG: DNA-deoxyinosine glycosylase, partial [Clostridiales bacterium]|nr:DNA-deoxyinosine glycosylase [Clostridiales bacterium]
MGQFVEHPFEPVYNNASRILILGSFPSVKSREGEFYYHHPQNRF